MEFVPLPLARTYEKILANCKTSSHIKLKKKTFKHVSQCCEFSFFYPFTEKLISGTREALCVPGSPGQSQSPPAGGGGGGGGGMGSRRGSISSLSSVTSMLEEKDDEKIRCCHHCMDTLLKRQQKLEEKDHMPDIVKLYEVGIETT